MARGSPCRVTLAFAQAIRPLESKRRSEFNGIHAPSQLGARPALGDRGIVSVPPLAPLGGSRLMAITGGLRLGCLRPRVAGIIGAGRSWTVWMSSVLSIPRGYAEVIALA
jgi:hypothetical protein